MNDIGSCLAANLPREPDLVMASPRAQHGRIEKREIWTTTEPVPGLDFPWAGQEAARRTVRKWRCARGERPATLGEPRIELVFGITSHTPESAGPGALLAFNRRHWTTGNKVNRILDDTGTWNEDGCQIRSGHGPENMTCLRRMAIGLIIGRGKPARPTIARLNRNPRLVLDYLRLSRNTRRRALSAAWTGNSPPRHRTNPAGQCPAGRSGAP